MELHAISDRYRAIALRLDVPEKHLRFFTVPQNDGSPHVECVGREFHYVVTERGLELERRATFDADELLFWMISDVTWAMALEWELHHRIEGEDFRRQFFRRHIELLSQISGTWAEQMRKNYERVLEKNPYRDRPAGRPIAQN